MFQVRILFCNCLTSQKRSSEIVNRYWYNNSANTLIKFSINIEIFKIGDKAAYQAYKSGDV